MDVEYWRKLQARRARRERAGKRPETKDPAERRKSEKDDDEPHVERAGVQSANFTACASTYIYSLEVGCRLAAGCFGPRGQVILAGRRRCPILRTVRMDEYQEGRGRRTVRPSVTLRRASPHGLVDHAAGGEAQITTHTEWSTLAWESEGVFAETSTVEVPSRCQIEQRWTVLGR